MNNVTPSPRTALVVEQSEHTRELLRSALVNIRNRRIEGRFIALQSHKSLLDSEMRF